jgi:trk system potassium uptake protein TrkA
MGIKIDENSLLLNKTLKEIYPNGEKQHFRNVAVLRNNETIIPDDETVFQNNDHTYFISDPEGEASIMAITNQVQRDIKRIMILGGSKIGYHAARLLSKKYSVKLIEEDKVTCRELAEKLSDTLVIQGDPRNIELLEEENINDMDIVIAVTRNSETNIISCLMAKNHEVFKTIALVENMDYIHLSQSVGVDTMINKRLIAANFIFRYIRKGDVMAMAGLHGADCEVLEFEVNPQDPIYHKSVKKLKFPDGAKIGGVVRNGEGIIPDDEFMFRDKDLVVVLSKPECIHKVEKLFV